MKDEGIALFQVGGGGRYVACESKMALAAAGCRAGDGGGLRGAIVSDREPEVAGMRGAMATEECDESEAEQRLFVHDATVRCNEEKGSSFLADEVGSG